MIGKNPNWSKPSNVSFAYGGKNGILDIKAAVPVPPITPAVTSLASPPD